MTMCYLHVLVRKAHRLMDHAQAFESRMKSIRRRAATADAPSVNCDTFWRKRKQRLARSAAKEGGGRWNHAGEVLQELLRVAPPERGSGSPIGPARCFKPQCPVFS